MCGGKKRSIYVNSVYHLPKVSSLINIPVNLSTISTFNIANLHSLSNPWSPLNVFYLNCPHSPFIGEVYNPDFSIYVLISHIVLFHFF